METRVNACGCASGPESFLWEAYSDGAFRPVSPPGPKPACSPSSLSSAVEEMGLFGGSPFLAFKRVACADGWAMAAGTGNAYTGPVMGLFEQIGGQWHNLQLDDGADLAYDLRLYDIPVSLFVRLGAELGPALPPKSARPGPRSGWDCWPVPP